MQRTGREARPRKTEMPGAFAISLEFEILGLRYLWGEPVKGATVPGSKIDLGGRLGGGRFPHQQRSQRVQKKNGGKRGCKHYRKESGGKKLKREKTEEDGVAELGGDLIRTHRT